MTPEALRYQRITRRENSCFPFQMTEGQFLALNDAANGYTLQESAQRFGVKSSTINKRRNSLLHFEPSKRSYMAPPCDTGMMALIQDGVNEGYLDLHIKAPLKPIVLQPKEEIIIKSVTQGASDKELEEATSLASKTLSTKKGRIFKKLKARNKFQAAANYTWLKNKGFIIFDSENKVLEMDKLLRPQEMRIINMLANGHTITDISKQLVIDRSSVGDHIFKLSFFKNKNRKNINPTMAVTALIQDGINFGYLNVKNEDRGTTKLTTPEKDFITLICQGQTRNEAFTQLSLSEWQFRTLINTTMNKLKANTLYHAVARYTVLKNRDLIEAI